MIKAFVWEPAQGATTNDSSVGDSTSTTYDVADEPARELTSLDQLEEISDLLAAKDRLIWLDLHRPSAEELRLVADEFGFHPLAVEDAANRHQRPKIDEYESFYFLVLYAVSNATEATQPIGEDASTAGPTQDGAGDARPDSVPISLTLAEVDATSTTTPNAKGSATGTTSPDADEEQSARYLTTSSFVLHEVSLFVGDRYLVTVHDYPVQHLARMLERWRHNRRAISDGIGVLLYSIVDPMVDAYFPVLDRILERAEAIQESLFVRSDHPEIFDIQALFQTKRDLLALRRVLMPERDVFLVLARQELPLFDRSVARYFRDVYDHVIRLADTLDIHQDLLTSALDAYLSQVSNRLAEQSNQLNQVMKTLTALTVTLMVPTLIAGIYGMNFAHMPELQWPLGYLWALALMVGLAGATFLYFRRNGWL